MQSIEQILSKVISQNVYYAYKHPPYVLEQKLIECIQLTDESQAIQTLKEINQLERATLATTPLTSLKFSLVASCTLFTRASIEVGVDPEQAFTLSDIYITKIDATTRIEDLHTLEYSMLSSFINLIKKNKPISYHPIIHRTITYIKEHLENNLTVKSIASYVDVHPNYLTTLFKQEVGISLSTYLAQSKIEKIKLLLRYTHMSLHEVADVFHFSSQAHFSTFFKKQTGVTPLHYRQHYTY